MELVGAGNEEDIAGKCHQCGRELNEVELPEGLENKVVCLDFRDNFVESFDELVEWREL